jgi:predicted nucleic acid-binding protein
LSRVLDTTVLIDVLRGHAPAVSFLASLRAIPSCSEISRVEVLRGLRSDERAAAERLFAALDWVPVDETISGRAGGLGRRFRRSHGGIATADLIVAATAEEVELRLATCNTKAFPMFRGLRPPYDC